MRANELGEEGALVYRKMRRVNGDVFLLATQKKEASEGLTSSMICGSLAKGQTKRAGHRGNGTSASLALFGGTKKMGPRSTAEAP